MVAGFLDMPHYGVYYQHGPLHAVAFAHACLYFYGWLPLVVHTHTGLYIPCGICATFCLARLVATRAHAVYIRCVLQFFPVARIIAPRTVRAVPYLPTAHARHGIHGYNLRGCRWLYAHGSRLPPHTAGWLRFGCYWVARWLGSVIPRWFLPFTGLRFFAVRHYTWLHGPVPDTRFRALHTRGLVAVHTHGSHCAGCCTFGWFHAGLPLRTCAQRAVTHTLLVCRLRGLRLQLLPFIYPSVAVLAFGLVTFCLHLRFLQLFTLLPVGSIHTMRFLV